MKMYVDGAWREGTRQIEVINPFHDSVVDTLPHGTAADVDAAVTALQDGSAAMRAMPEFERSQMLTRAARLILEHSEELARTISLEEGKILAEARVEVRRAAEIVQLSAEEAKRLGGEVLPGAGAGKAAVRNALSGFSSSIRRNRGGWLVVRGHLFQKYDSGRKFIF